MVDFHPDRSLPDCMMPDGGECCRGHYDLVVDWRRLKTASKGWISVRDELPAMNDTVVCTDGRRRWLDMRMPGLENLIWQGHLATHWHPLADLPAVVGSATGRRT